MLRLPLLLTFICILLNQQRAACTPLSSYEEIEQSPYPSRSSFLRNAWYDQLNDINESEQEEPIDNMWKRVASEVSAIRQRRRFGNTRYGRSIPSTLQ